MKFKSVDLQTQRAECFLLLFLLHILLCFTHTRLYISKRVAKLFQTCLCSSFLAKEFYAGCINGDDCGAFRYLSSCNSFRVTFFFYTFFIISLRAWCEILHGRPIYGTTHCLRMTSCGSVNCRPACYQANSSNRDV